MSGFGSGGWGSVPWGGASIIVAAAPTPSIFDIYCYSDPCGPPSMLTDPNVSTVDAGGQVAIDTVNCALLVRSGGAFPTADAQVYISSIVPSSWTLQFEAEFLNLPASFSALVTEHIFIGTTNASGPCAGLFFSKAGIAYAGGVHFDGSNNLVLDSSLVPIPGSSTLIQENVEYTVRIAADSATSTTYIFFTKTADVATIGHQLIAILPGIIATDLAFPPIDVTTISARGTLASTSYVSIGSICLGTGLIIPNLPPVADAGVDQAIRKCSILQLDGTGSFDPEGVPVTYLWSLVDAPATSVFAVEGADGNTAPLATPTGFTDKFYSDTLAVIDSTEPFVAGDVLNLSGTYYTISGTGVGGELPGFHLLLSTPIIPDNFTNTTFKVLRQYGISGATTAKPTFLPDKAGFYTFQLVVSDGALDSEPATVIVNVLESPLPRGCTFDLSFVFGYLSDFWNLVEDKERISVFWEGLMQVAAAELLTLWQIDYSKSLRDIQRTFRRKWLHYDLLLAEPLPEVTTVRAVWGGVQSGPIPLAGAALSGLAVEVSSPVLAANVRVVLAGTNPLTATQVANQLLDALQQADERFTVTVVSNNSPPAATPFQYIRIDAPFDFTLEETSTALPPQLATFGPSNAEPNGSGGIRLGDTVYLVNRSLQGLSIQPNDLLSIDGESYRIVQILDNTNDEWPFQRVTLLDPLPSTVGGDWAISGYITSNLLNFYAGLVTSGDDIFLEVAQEDAAGDAAELVQVEALGACSAAPSTLAFSPVGAGRYLVDDTSDVFLAKIIRNEFLPISDLVVDIPYLQELVVIQDDETTLRRNVDYFLEEKRGQKCIRFETAVWEDQPPPDRLWAENTYIDNRPTIEENFGLAVDFTLDDLALLPSTVDYLSAVRGLWYAYLRGPTLFNLRVGVQILLGLPFAEQPGTITEIRSDFSPTSARILIQDAAREEIVRSYTYPKTLAVAANPTTGAPYVVGDAVAQFAPLTEGVEIVDYVKDPRWFEGLLNQGVFFEVEKFHKFLVRSDSAAFNLDALLFAQSFVLKVKPTYTYPLFVVRQRIDDDEISVSDERQYNVELLLFDSVCRSDGLAHMLDQYRPAGGGVRNQLDSDGDPDNAPPVFPVSEPVEFGLDRGLLCPEDLIVFTCCVTLSGPEPFGNGYPFPLDSCFALDTGAIPTYRFIDAAVAAVPAGPAGLTLTPSPITADYTGTLEEVRLTIAGDPGADPTDYELVVQVNAADTDVLAFTASAPAVDLAFVISTPITAADTVTVRIRPASGGARAPNWATVRVSVLQSAVPLFIDMGGDPVGPPPAPPGLEAGTYCAETQVAP